VTAPTPDEFRRAMAMVPTAVTVVTADGDAGPSGATANAVVALSLEPLLMLASLHRESRTLAAITVAGRFAINVLGSEQEGLARQFSSRGPTDEKWAGVDWEPIDDTPWLGGALVTLSCELRDRIPGGDHEIVIGEVLSLESRDGSPLLFHRGAYPSLE
jgi:flavin reductase (DIM6/NTAB) family NADH-FMN oxidoreductase RutF